MVCAFGGEYARGDRLNGSSVVCISPRRMSAGVVSVELSWGRNAVGGPAVSFMYEEAASVLGVWPTAGSTHGGTMVEVRGIGFSVQGRMHCKFGGAVVSGGGSGRVLAVQILRQAAAQAQESQARPTPQACIAPFR